MGIFLGEIYLLVVEQDRKVRVVKKVKQLYTAIFNSRLSNDPIANMDDFEYVQPVDSNDSTP